MWTWVPLLLAALSILQTCQQEVEPSEPETPGSEPEPLNLVDNSTLCFNVKPAACGATEEKETCLCQALNPETVYCCFITNPYQLNNNLRCAGIQPSNVKYMHIRNATLEELKYFAFEAWPKLESFSITEGKIEKISFEIHSNLSCFNASSNAISDIDVNVFHKLHELRVLDLSNNNLTKLPSLRNDNISMDLSDNRGVECQTLMQFLTEHPQTNFINVDSTYCFSSKNFHWFNSIAQVPLSQVLLLRNIEQNCTKGCSCRSHRLDMVSGKHPTISVLVDCSALGLKKLPEYLPTNTISLNVSYNNITSLDPLTFDESYKDIREFYADYNQISSILALEGSKFIDNFLVLSLRENNIKSLPTYILSNTFDRNYHIRRVNLGGNKLVCNCSVAQVVKVWLLSNKKHIPDYDQLLCDNTGEKVLALDQNKVCVYQRDWTDYIYYIIAGEICLLLLLVGKVSYDYWMFKTTGYLPWPASKMPKLPCDWVLE
ncbi:hypothetical protein RUM43_005491 [Polyplax serrata]|uniref:Protein halfway n=1 Tax=Polyplax serrata TaxID=468196 RepID=A0AAN8PJD9_POLSC